MTTETSYRSILKAISYRGQSTIITSCIVFGVTGKGDLAFAVAVFDSLIKLISYYLHERAWTFVRFGFTDIPAAEVNVYHDGTELNTNDIRTVLSKIELTQKA